MAPSHFLSSSQPESEVKGCLPAKTGGIQLSIMDITLEQWSKLEGLHILVCTLALIWHSNEKPT